MIRGGSWGLVAGVCRAANRSRCAPVSRRDYLGFRLARAPQAEWTLCPTEPTAFPVPLPATCNGQIVTRRPSSAGSKREGSGRSFFSAELQIAEDLQCLKVECYGFAAKAFDLLGVRRMKQQRHFST